MRRARILEVAGVADQGPSRSERLAQIATHAAERPQSRPRALDGGRDLGRHPEEEAAEGRLGASGEGLRATLCGDADEDAVLAGIGRDRSRRRPWREEPAIAVVREPREIAEEHRGRVAPLVIGARTDHFGDRRADAVGTDDHACPNLDLALWPGEDGARDPAVGSADQIDQAVTPQKHGPGRLRRIGEDRIQHRPPRCIEGVYAAFGLERNGHVDAGIVEFDPAHRLRARGRDRIEQSPALELRHRAAHQRVRRERVVAAPAAVDDQDPSALPGQEHRRGGAGAARADNDCVEIRPRGAQEIGSLHGALLRQRHAAAIADVTAGAAAAPRRRRRRHR